eukprot:scaffold11437_cov75-Phaeocystis_antarctica.AAC.2
MAVSDALRRSSRITASSRPLTHRPASGSRSRVVAWTMSSRPLPPLVSPSPSPTPPPPPSPPSSPLIFITRSKNLEDKCGAEAPASPSMRVKLAWLAMVHAITSVYCAISESPRKITARTRATASGGGAATLCRGGLGRGAYRSRPMAAMSVPSDVLAPRLRSKPVALSSSQAYTFRRRSETAPNAAVGWRPSSSRSGSRMPQ